MVYRSLSFAGQVGFIDALTPLALCYFNVSSVFLLGSFVFVSLLSYYKLLSHQYVGGVSDMLCLLAVPVLSVCLGICQSTVVFVLKIK